MTTTTRPLTQGETLTPGSGEWHYCRQGFFQAVLAASAANRLLVEVGHHLLERSIPGLVGFAKLLHDLRRKKEN